MAPMDVTPARVPERRLSPREVEDVIGRAIELHVRESAHARGDELTELDVLRIGHELGLDPASVQRALAERGGVPDDSGWLGRYVGDRRASSSRVVRRPAGEVEDAVDRYLRDTETMVVERRHPGRTVYVRAKGLLAMSMRVAGRVGRKHAPLDAVRLEVGVQPLDGVSCCVALTVDLEAKRREHVAVGGTLGAAGGLSAGLLLGTMVAPPLAVVGLPVVGIGLVASRLAYRGARSETLERVESVLDRLEHGELRRGHARGALRAFGL